jgi:MFS family permease
VHFSTGEFVFALVLATLLSLLVFGHADRHGNRRATAWGVVTFFFGFFAVAVYFARFYMHRRV